MNTRGDGTPGDASGARGGALLASARSLVLATVDGAGEPEASHAPFVLRPGEGFYVYVSELSRHTRNLLQSKRASVLVLADERDTPEPFARERLTVRCAACRVERGSPRWEAVMGDFASRFGEIVATLRELPDFHLLLLVPGSAVHVRGFAQAHRYEGAALEALLAAAG